MNFRDKTKFKWDLLKQLNIFCLIVKEVYKILVITHILDKINESIIIGYIILQELLMKVDNHFFFAKILFTFCYINSVQVTLIGILFQVFIEFCKNFIAEMTILSSNILCDLLAASSKSVPTNSFQYIVRREVAF